MSLIQREHDGRLLLIEIQIMPLQAFKISSENQIEIGSDKIFPFNAIFDTGCTTTSISSRVVHEVGLEPVGKTQVAGNTGTTVSDTYLYQFGFLDGKGHIDHYPEPIQGIKFDSSGHDFDVLIGMDVITMGDLTIKRNPPHFTFQY